MHALVTACAGYHHTAGPGDQPTHPVAYLVRAVLVKTLYSWSLRECADQINHHLVVKWFVGYPVFASGPDYTTLARFEQWVSAHHGRAFFDEEFDVHRRGSPFAHRPGRFGPPAAVRGSPTSK
ncbi:MAG: transposase [Chloroflexi bacterium]|nr:transposase [Chloroflexota bacterium]